MENLTFINPQILERLEQGSFVAHRRSQTNSLALGERRDAVSPLAVTKRCVRYEPQVFSSRKKLLLKLGKGLNNPGKKVLLISGPAGCGKTSLARGIIEMMGGGQEQLLWFDVNIHTDFDEIIHFLIQYITYLSATLGIGAPPETGDPFKRLEQLISNVAHIPLLIVIDQMEYIVDREYKIHSHPLKEVLNFLLTFDNIKMALVGERLPYADVSTTPSVLLDLRLEALPPSEMQPGLEKKLLTKFSTDTTAPSIPDLNLVKQLFEQTQGYPWLVNFLLSIQRHHVEAQTLYQFIESHENRPGLLMMLQFVSNHLTSTERQILALMACIRHPVDMKTLFGIIRNCIPELSTYPPEKLIKSMIRALLKKSYPPQSVLEHMREHHPLKEFLASYELYRPLKKVLYDSIPDTQKGEFHRLLHEFYLKEKGKPLEQRVCHLKTKALSSEMKFHTQCAQNYQVETFTEVPQVQGKAYLYNTLQPPPGEKLVTLDDYRKIQLPEGLWESDHDVSNFFTAANFPDETFEPEEMISEEAFDEALLGQETAPKKSAKNNPLNRIETFVEPASKSHPSAESSPLHEFKSLHRPVMDETEKQLHENLAKAVVNQDQAEMIHEMMALARYRESIGLFDSAEECLKKVLNFPSSLIQPHLGEIHALMGNIHKETYRHQSALQHLQQALQEIPQDAAHGEWLGNIYQSLGEIDAFKGQTTQSIAHYKQAISFYQQSNRPSKQAEALFKLALVYDDLGQKKEALSFYERSLALDKTHNNPISCAATLANMGSLCFELAQQSQAIEYFLQSIQYDQSAGNTSGEFNTLGLLALAYLKQSNWTLAEETYHQALALALNQLNKLWQATVYLKLGDLYRIQQKWEQALSAYQMAQKQAPGELSEKSQQLLDIHIKEIQRVLHPS